MTHQLPFNKILHFYSAFINTHHFDEQATIMDPISSKELLKLLETVLDAAKQAENDDAAERVSSPPSLPSINTF